MDLEAKAAAAWAFSDAVRVGVETRLRSEVELGEETAPAPGREYDFVVGPAVSLRIHQLELKAMGGWGVPRGTASPGPMGMALLAFDL